MLKDGVLRLYPAYIWQCGRHYLIQILKSVRFPSGQIESVDTFTCAHVSNTFPLTWQRSCSYFSFLTDAGVVCLFRALQSSLLVPNGVWHMNDSTCRIQPGTSFRMTPVGHFNVNFYWWFVQNICLTFDPDRPKTNVLWPNGTSWTSMSIHLGVLSKKNMVFEVSITLTFALYHQNLISCWIDEDTPLMDISSKITFWVLLLAEKEKNE